MRTRIVYPLLNTALLPAINTLIGLLSTSLTRTLTLQAVLVIAYVVPVSTRINASIIEKI